MLNDAVPRAPISRSHSGSHISAPRAVPGWIGSTLSYGGYGLAIAIFT